MARVNSDRLTSCTAIGCSSIGLGMNKFGRPMKAISRIAVWRRIEQTIPGVMLSRSGGRDTGVSRRRGGGHVGSGAPNLFSPRIRPVVLGLSRTRNGEGSRVMILSSSRTSAPLG